MTIETQIFSNHVNMQAEVRRLGIKHFLVYLHKILC